MKILEHRVEEKEEEVENYVHNAELHNIVACRPVARQRPRDKQIYNSSC
jgi:hypothetical protein